MLTRRYVQKEIATLLKKLPRKECRTCDCLQGFLTQLEIDAQEDISDITEPLKVPGKKMHGCLGCDPCPPGATFSKYIRKGKNK
jgi:hypothetical protein